ncbi:MAG TPA: DUF4340 domain-containing protein [Polyangia bacterium]|jgi:hypothetical protein|nr:DUF4340 domain-containing protein [Polyangia bacterium]
MNRKTITAVAAFAILGFVALFALRQPEKGESAGDKQRPISKIDPNALDTVSITRGGVTSTLKREGGKVKVTAPVAAAADDTNVKAAFEALEKLELGNLVTENKAKQAEFEVDDAKAIHVVAKSEKAGQTLADLYVGKASGNGTMVRLAGKDEVWQASGPLRSTFDKSAADWRDRSITTFPAADAEMITVKAKDGGVAILKKNGKGSNGEDQWQIVTSVPKFDKVDNAAANALVSAMSAFKANDFAEGATPAQTGLDAPSSTVTVGLKGGKNVTVLVGGKKAPDELYVKTGDAPQIYVVKNFNVDHVAKKPLDFKDKTLADISEADLSEVAVSHGADSYTLVHDPAGWKATRPAKFQVDPGRTPAIGGAFKDWKAASFADDTAPATTGLAKPKATVAIKSKKGEAITFKIGDESKDKQNVYLQSSKSPSDVFLAPKWSTDRLLVKLDELKKK